MTGQAIQAALVAAGASAANAGRYADPLSVSCEARGIARGDIANLLAEVMNESGDLAFCEELMAYRTAARIVAVFPSHFHGPGALARARGYVGKPVALGNFVYAALGGYAARGEGLAQLTGVANHVLYAAAVGRPAATIEAYMSTPVGAADSACWYFVHYGCRGLADPRAVRCKWAGQAPGSEPIGLANVLRLHAILARALDVGASPGPAPDALLDTTASLNAASAAGILTL